jgi:16S rRNA (guanine527-N7)-methyltransferase
MTGHDRAALLAVLDEARDLGLFGPGPVDRQYEHAADLARAVGAFAGDLLDLGSGGGVPGLVLLHEWPEARGVLLDAQQRRCDFLARSIQALDLSARAAVVCGRAEVLARDERLRARFDLVVARSFGPPAVTAECAVGFLVPGGALVVTEPPGDTAEQRPRWDPAGLAELGLGAPSPLRAGATGAVRLEMTRRSADRWPRRDGVPSKRPLW